MNQKFINIVLVGFLLFVISSDLFSQRRSSRSDRNRDRDRDTETIVLKDKLAFDIILNPYIGGGIALSTKLGAGYKITDAFTAGAGVRLNYQFINNFGNTADYSAFHYGYFPFLRYKIGDSYYVKAEYLSYSFDTGNDNADRINERFPLIGGGYMQGFGRWTFGAEIMLLLDRALSDFPNNEVSDIYPLIDYHIAILYNF